MEMTAVMGREERQKLFPSLPTLPWKARKNRELPTFPQLRRRLGVSFFSQARLTSTSTKSVTYMPGTFCYRHARSHTEEDTSGFSSFGHLLSAHDKILKVQKNPTQRPEPGMASSFTARLNPCTSRI